MEAEFYFKKGQVTEDFIDTELYDWLYDNMINIKKIGNYPEFKDNFKVRIIIETM